MKPILPVQARAGAALALVVLALAPACRATRTEEPAGVAERLRADVAWLADDAREGRRAGTAGEREAAEWLARALAEAGVEAAGTDGFLQPFPVPLPLRDGGASAVTVLDTASVGEAEPSGERFEGAERVVPLAFSPAAEARGRIAFRGFGITAPERAWDDWERAGVAGAVVVLVRGKPRGGREPEAPADGSNAGDGWGASATLFHKARTAQQHGAAAVVIAPDPASDEPLPDFDASLGLVVGIPAVAVDLATARALVPGYERAAQELAERDWLDWASERAEAQVVREALVHADVVRADGTAHNVLGLLRGGGPTVVVGAHFDHLGRGGAGSLARDAQGEIHNGADDNASGTAVVIELARRLAGREIAGDVLFALWSGEELGLLGSEYWADSPTIPLERVAANLNLDMVGRAGGGELQVLAAGSSPAFPAWLEEAGALAGLELHVSTSSTGIGGSDHQTFLRRRIPALHLFSGLHDDYHRPSDDVEGFEAEGAARVATLAEALVLTMLAAEGIPFVEPPREGGEGPARPARWSVWFGTQPDYAYDGPGMRLSGTSPGSPAEEAGLAAGDVIRRVGEVAVEDLSDFMYALQVHKPGDVVRTLFERGGDELSVLITLRTRQAE